MLFCTFVTLTLDTMLHCSSSQAHQFALSVSDPGTAPIVLAAKLSYAVSACVLHKSDPCLLYNIMGLGLVQILAADQPCYLKYICCAAKLVVELPHVKSGCCTAKSEHKPWSEWRELSNCAAFTKHLAAHLVAWNSVASPIVFLLVIRSCTGYMIQRAYSLHFKFIHDVSKPGKAVWIGVCVADLGIGSELQVAVESGITFAAEAVKDIPMQVSLVFSVPLWLHGG